MRMPSSRWVAADWGRREGYDELKRMSNVPSFLLTFCGAKKRTLRLEEVCGHAPPASLRKFQGVGQRSGRLRERRLRPPEDGRLELCLTWKTLCLRKQQRTLFQAGRIRAPSSRRREGQSRGGIHRKSEAASALVVVPRLVAGLLNDIDLRKDWCLQGLGGVPSRTLLVRLVD